MGKFVTIDTEKCLKCGACAETCPLLLYKFEKGHIPKAVVWAKRACMNCGQCVCVCPAGALSLEKMSIEECDKIDRSSIPTPDQIKQFVRTRRSTRKYKEDPIEKELLEDLISEARYAPTGHNRQNVKWKVFYSSAEVSRLRESVLGWMRKSAAEDNELARVMHMDNIIQGCEAGIDIILRGAPHVIVAYGGKDDRIAYSSCMIAMTYLDLIAQSFNFGTCWAGFLDMAFAHDASIQEDLGLPEGYRSYASMMIGYPKYPYYRMPARNEADISFS